MCKTYTFEKFDGQILKQMTFCQRGQVHLVANGVTLHLNERDFLNLMSASADRLKEETASEQHSSESIH